jgi:hypothetical protein
MQRCDEPGENGSCRVSRRYVHDRRQYPFHPRRFPKAARREDVLHVDGQMHRVGDWFDRGGIRHDPSAPFFKPATTPACVEAFRREFEGCAGNAFGKPEFTLRS